ncbi:MAG: alanine--tRNA ligase [Candidatus Nanohaloarchaea archaeon]
MPALEKLKKEIKEEASEKPDKFFATEILRQQGYKRSECSSCGIYFWSRDESREVCGEPDCSGGYTFIGDSPTEEKLTHAESWKLFSDFMEQRGYSSIDRYPVIARWRDDVEFTGASIYCFQPYVVSGEAEPPADELVIPQPSLRFNDVDNVGITGRHYTNFTMIGQTCFQPPEKYDRDRYFRDMMDFTSEALGIPEEKMIFHEEAWGGGGNLGPCMECFVDGLELWNQVYMLYEITPEGYQELDLQVLDMGMGHERITWISRGTETSYESVMPETLERMKQRTGIEVDREVWEKFLPYSSYLNIDEVEDIEEEWKKVAKEMDMEVEELKDEIKPVAALYSIAEHARALLFALADGKLPSNTGGGHNLRMVYRRAQDFIEKYEWDLEMGEVAEWNAEELEQIFPELLESIDEVREILQIEQEKYRKARRKARQKLDEVDSQPSLEKMVELYESHGVSPKMMEDRGFSVPEDFYAKVASEDESKVEGEEKFDLEGVEDTELLFYGDETRKEMEAEVVATRREWVVLDRTVFYPEGGGQEADRGKIIHEGESYRVSDVQKQGGVVLHRVPGHGLEKGDRIEGSIEWERRRQLMQHHSTTHMVNGASVELLGDHVYQAGAHKTVEKARLDITHYEKLSRQELDSIEEKVRSMIWNDLDIEKEVLEKSAAEQRHGFRIYQGGAPPGDEVRIVKILDEGGIVDVEACGGTHLDSTSEAEDFIIVGSNKVQDGVIRLNYRAGEAARQYLNRIESRIEEISEMLGFEEPDNHRQAERELEEVFSVDADNLVSTLENFRQENEELAHRIKKLADYLERGAEIPEIDGETLIERAESLFETRKQREKKLEELESGLEQKLKDEMVDRVIEEEIPTENIGLLIQLARELARDYQASVTLVGEEGAVSASYHEDFDADLNLEKYSDSVEGDENLAKAFDIQ